MTSDLPLQAFQLGDIKVSIPANIYENLDASLKF